MMTIKEILITRDGMEPHEADALIEEAREAVSDCAAAGGSIIEVEEIVQDFFGLEPDYLVELLP